MSVRFPAAATRLAIIVMLLAVWEVSARLFGDPLFISPPSRVIMALVHLSSDQEVRAAIGVTCWELICAFVISVSVGLVVGLLVGWNRFTKDSVYPIVLLLYAMPMVTILPLFVLVFGIGSASKIAFGVIHGVFPVVMTVVAGMQNIPQLLIRSARSMGANSRQILFSVIFPHMVPSFFTGLRLSMTAVLFGVLIAELYVSQSGIGHFTTEFTQTFQPRNLFALVSVLAAIAVTLNELCRSAERRFSRWHK